MKNEMSSLGQDVLFQPTRQDRQNLSIYFDDSTVARGIMADGCRLPLEFGKCTAKPKVRMAGQLDGLDVRQFISDFSRCARIGDNFELELGRRIEFFPRSELRLLVKSIFASNEQTVVSVGEITMTELKDSDIGNDDYFALKKYIAQRIGPIARSIPRANTRYVAFNGSFLLVAQSRDEHEHGQCGTAGRYPIVGVEVKRLV